MAQTHTPGPWHAGETVTTGCKVKGDYSSFSTVAQRIARPADQALIAAAPDLLAAIEGLLNCAALREDAAAPSTECAIENAQIAVRKARGIASC